MDSTPTSLRVQAGMYMLTESCLIATRHQVSSPRLRNMCVGFALLVVLVILGTLTKMSH